MLPRRWRWLVEGRRRRWLQHGRGAGGFAGAGATAWVVAGVVAMEVDMVGVCIERTDVFS